MGNGAERVPNKVPLEKCLAGDREYGGGPCRRLHENEEKNLYRPYQKAGEFPA